MMILYIVYDHHHLYIKKRKQICMSWVYSFYLGLSLIHLPQLFGNLRLWREVRGGAGPTKKSVYDDEEKTGGDVQLFPWLTMIMMMMMRLAMV